MDAPNKSQPKQISIKQWYWALFFLTLLIGALFTYYVAKTQDTEMRETLITYASTIEQSIDWAPYQTLLNSPPEQHQESEFSALHAQLNSACRANKDCHFIYMMYLDKAPDKTSVKFLLDASPQPPSEISHLGDVFDEASSGIRQALKARKGLVEGPVTDHWGTWVSAHVPVSVTSQTPHFVMLGIDVAVNNWKSRVFKKTIVPIISTLVFACILLGFIYQSSSREKLLAQLLSSQSALSELANNDALTGLPNRRLLEDRMTQALKEASRAQKIVAVLFVDLDFFKVVNDTHGHSMGDELLKQAAQRLTSLLRSEDTVARIGGDEFVVLLPQVDDESQVKVTVEKILAELTLPFKIAEIAVQISASIGVALYPTHEENADNLIKCADRALFSAKRKGRNCYAVYNTENPFANDA